MNSRFVNDAHSAWGQFIAMDLFMHLDNFSELVALPVPRCTLAGDADGDAMAMPPQPTVWRQYPQGPLPQPGKLSTVEIVAWACTHWRAT